MVLVHHLSGTVVSGRYQIEKKLGQGGFGQVWSATDLTSGSQVALKFLLSDSRDDAERLLREAQILYRHHGHPHVVRYLDSDFAHVPPYIVMERCAFSLERFVTGALAWRDSAALLQHACLGLLNIHSAGGFHRDLKPGNLLIAVNPDNTLCLKVADFGLARQPTTENPSITRHLGGTFGYIAPEVLSGFPFSAAADIYSLGVVFLELLTGTRDGFALDRSDSPPALKQLVRAMMKSRPSHRPSLQDVANSVWQILNQASPTVEKSSLADWAAPLALGGLLAMMFAGANSRKWDAKAGRYRDARGRFV